MANVLSNNTSIKFANVPSTTGIYRYEVYVDSELVFIGNTYLEANETPIIDVTDIIKNYVDINKPPYSTSGEKSTIYKTISVTLYMDDTEYSQTTQLFMIYENPFYNSKVTTNILDDFTTSSIGTMPMLQGWNYSDTRGYFVPTYPAVASDVFTFDMVCGYQRMPIINDFSVNYGNGLIDKPKYIQLRGNGIYQYSLPLSTLLRGGDGSDYVFDTITDLFSFSTFASYYSYEDTEYKVERDEYLKRQYTNTRYAEGNPALPVITQYTRVYYTNGVDELVEFRTIGDSDGADNYTITYEFTNILNIDHINIYLEFDDGYEDILTITPNVTNWKQINIVDNSLDRLTINLSMKPEGGLSVNEYIAIITDKITLDMIASVCDAKTMDIITFSPVQSGQRYTYTIAKFDNKSRFFLKWQDRYGMPQCQPFGGTHKYNEKIDKTTTINYLNKSKIIDIISTNSWSLNTNWIQQEYFPYYESIFVSPWLQLYDAHEDKLYDVILVNNSYDEKTFKNQNKQLFNLQLDVELDTKQYMTY